MPSHKRRTTKRPSARPKVSPPHTMEVFRFITDRVDDLVVVLSLKGRLLYASPSYTRILGDQKVSLRSKAFNRIHSDDRAILKRILKDAIRTGSSRKTELRFLHPDGGIRYLESEGHLVRKKSGKPSRVVVISRDITRAKESENELRLLAYALSCTKDCFCLTDLDNNFLFVNPAFCETYGYSEQELLGQNVSIVQSISNPPELLEKVLPFTLAGGWNGELVNRRKDGSELLMELWTSVVRDSDGEPVAYVGIARDCTDRKRAEKEIQLLQTMMQAINQTPDVQSALAVAIRRICEFTGWVMGQAWVPGADGSVLECSSAWYKKSDELHEFRSKNKELVFSPGTGLPGRVWLEKRPMWIERLQDEKGSARVELFERSGIRSGFALPIVVKQKVFAVMEFFLFEERKEDEPTLKLINALTLQLDSVLERKQAEEALQKNVSLLTSTLNSTGDGILVVDMKGKVLRFNVKFIEMWRIPRSLLAFRDDRRLLEYVLNQVVDPESFLMKVRELYTMPDAESFDTLDFKDGRVMERRSLPQRVEGKSIGRVWNFHDITEQRRAARVQQAVYEIAQAADRSETLDGLFKEVHNIIRTIMPADNLYIALHDVETGLISFPYFVDEVDVPAPPQKLGRGLTEYVLRTGKSLLCNKALDDELQAKGEVEMVGVSSPIWLGVPLVVGHTPIGVITVQHYSDPHAYGERERRVLEFVSSQIARAIDKKQTDEKVRTSEEKYRRLFEESTDAILVSNPEGEILDGNRAAVELFGYSSKQELLHANVARDLCAHPEVRETLKSMLAQHGFVNDFEYVIKTRNDDRRIVLESASAVRDDHGNIVAFRGFLRDITERKRLEDHLRQAQKMESIGTLAGGIAHDFNNLLGIILGYTSLLEGEKVDAERTQLCIATIKKAVDRGASLVSQLLTFARKSETWFESVNVNDTVVELVKMLYQTFPKHITITSQLERHMPSILADSSQLHQALLNLCLNSRDAILDKNKGGATSGTLTIETRIVQGEALRQKFTDATAQEYAAICVADSGTGMSDETKRRIFEPFFTTKELGKGTGLGLSVVYGVVNNLRGLVDVDSELGRGTTFLLYFPIQRRILEPAQTDHALPGDVPLGDETILVVEDEEMLLSLVQSILTESGYSVLTANDGQEGIEIFQEHRDQIACVLTDMGLPRLGGWEMFKKMKEIKPEVKAIMASGYCEPKLRAEMIKEGAKDFIQKPYIGEVILKRIREVIDEVV